MKHIIVTGGTGFFGINLVTELLQRGYTVAVTVRPGSLHRGRLEGLGSGLTVIENDVGNIDELPVLLAERFGRVPLYDTFYHLAWSGGRNDFTAQLQNISDTMKALEVAGELGCKRFICSGSQAEYGATTERIEETSPLKPFSAYGAAKVSACYLSRIRAEELKIDWIWGRIFSLIGRYEPDGRMLPDLIEKLKKGETVALSSCEQYWDYLDAEDAAKAFVLLGENGKAGEIYNIANGEYRRLKEFTEEVRAYFGDEASSVQYGEDPTPFVSLKPSVEKLKRDTGWRPEISFKESLKRYI